MNLSTITLNGMTRLVHRDRRTGDGRVWERRWVLGRTGLDLPIECVRHTACVVRLAYRPVVNTYISVFALSSINVLQIMQRTPNTNPPPSVRPPHSCSIHSGMLGLRPQIRKWKLNKAHRITCGQVSCEPTGPQPIRLRVWMKSQQSRTTQ